MVALTVGLSAASAQTETKPEPPAEPLSWQGNLEAQDVTESSGLARSSIIPDAFARNIDWEAMSDWQSGDDHFIVVADTGDNLRLRSEYRIYFAKEPKVKPGKTKIYKKSAPAVGVKFRFESATKSFLSKSNLPKRTCNTLQLFFVYACLPKT